jgi:hypothetical protein
MTDFRGLLAAGLCIIESAENTSNDLKSVLESRLTRYYACLELDTTLDGSETLQSLELTTATEALNVLERVHGILDAEDAPIGTRDLAELRTLVAIAFKWGVDPLLSRAMLAWPSKSARPQIIDLTTAPEEYKLLCSMMSRLLSIVLPTSSPTFVATTLLNRHLDQLLRPCIAIGWLPKSLATDSTPESIRPMTMRLLDACVVPLCVRCTFSKSCQFASVSDYHGVGSRIVSEAMSTPRPQGVRISPQQAVITT